MYDVWKNALAEIEQKISPANFSTWFQDTSLLSTENGAIKIGVKNTFYVKQLRARYLDIIETALKNVDSSIEKVNDRLKELGTDTSMLDDTLKEVSDRIAKINEGITQIDTAVKGLDDNTVTVNDALTPA